MPNERYVYGHGGTGEPTVTWKQLADWHRRLADWHLRIACCCTIEAMPDEAVAGMKAELEEIGTTSARITVIKGATNASE